MSEVQMSFPPADGLSFTRRRVGDVTVLDLTGDITIIDESSCALRREIRSLIQGGEAKILLNLARVRYVDSSGLGELVSGLAAVSRVGGKLGLLGVGENVREVLRMTRLDQAFDMYDDELREIKQDS